jgi:hypothetical protein
MNVILWELHEGSVQECDFKGFAGDESSRRTPDKLLTRLILRTWGAAVLRPYMCVRRACASGGFVRRRSVVMSASLVYARCADVGGVERGVSNR